MNDLELREALAREVFDYGKVGGLFAEWGYSASSKLLRVDDLPAYESSYEGMGLVIEAMERKGWDCAIEFAHSMAFVAFATIGHKPWEYIEREEALTAPRAVALAALAAIRSEK
ncbi:MAG: hypothetical protein KDA51_03865 [Planctomycetales bacterium]|nr:hypothetical protein [Planctomycetales bacterium]